MQMSTAIARCTNIGNMWLSATGWLLSVLCVSAIACVVFWFRFLCMSARVGYQLNYVGTPEYIFSFNSWYQISVPKSASG